MAAFDDLAAIGISIIPLFPSLIVWLRTRPIEQKQFQVSTMFKIFGLLSNPEYRAAKKTVADEYRSKKDAGDLVIFSRSADIRSKADWIKSSYDQVYALVYEGIVDEETFFRIYGGSVVRTWKILEDDIKKDWENDPRISENFKSIKERFEKWFVNVPIPYRG